MDRELQYQARMILREKQAKAVKDMILTCDGGETSEAQAGASTGPFILGRICSATMYRRGMGD